MISSLTLLGCHINWKQKELEQTEQKILAPSSAILSGGHMALVILGTFKGGHRLETTLHTPLSKVHDTIYTILIQPGFLSHCVYGSVQKQTKKD